MAEKSPSITEISVAGFKSIVKGSIEIRPLTILAGANSSGKSSIMQPMLLMKQTLDATHDPGPLLLDGPHVRFSRFEHFLSVWGNGQASIMTVGFKYDHDIQVRIDFGFTLEIREGQRQIEISRMLVESKLYGKYNLSPGLTSTEIVKMVPKRLLRNMTVKEKNQKNEEYFEGEWGILASRCFLQIVRFAEWPGGVFVPYPPFPFFPDSLVQSAIENLIHISGLRGKLARTYIIAPVQTPRVTGAFENYIAGLILRWQEEKDKRLDRVGKNLQSLGLTGWVRAEPLDDVNVELRVGRLPVGRKSDLEKDNVNIADVGFGVSQVLPVLVALVVAEPGQMVYIEQPELHLHPRAQVAMAEVLADAAKRGVRLVVETHSPLLLQGVMTLIAEDKLESDKVILHWFRRTEEGKTKITPGSLDENGAYGDWPEDFMEAEMAIQGRYLDAVAERELAV